MTKYIAIGAFVVTFLLGWVLRGELAPKIVYPDADTSLTVRHTSQPPDSGHSIGRPGKVKPDPSFEALRQSYNNQGTILENVLTTLDSMKRENDSLSVDRSGTIEAKILGRFDWIYLPTLRDLLWNHFPPKRVDSVTTVKVMVPAEPGFFYDLARWFEGGATVALVFLSLIVFGGM